jgi:hypothetical protein
MSGMGKWLIDRQSQIFPLEGQFNSKDWGALEIRRPDATVAPYESKIIFENDKFAFAAVYAKPSYRMTGYKVYFTNNPPTQKKHTNFGNNFAVFMFAKKSKDTKPPVNLIYDDQVVRLISWDHKNGEQDFLLVGRWRV